MPATIQRTPFDELPPRTLYQLLRLRSEVFVVEQDCVYLDMDDKDYHRELMHLYMEETDEVIAYARCLPPKLSFAEGCSIGRVVVSPKHRGRGLARKIVLAAIAECQERWPQQSIVIGAQAYLEAFYQSLGFVSHGEPYSEDNIPHIKMCKA